MQNIRLKIANPNFKKLVPVRVASYQRVEIMEYKGSSESNNNGSTWNRPAEPRRREWEKKKYTKNGGS